MQEDSTISPNNSTALSNRLSFSEDLKDLSDDDYEIDIGDEAQLAAEAKFWKSTLDAKSGRTYWYNVETRETQWRKPVCLSNSEERMAVAVKEKQQRDFFSAMEANILSSMSVGTRFENKDEDDDSDSDSSLHNSFANRLALAKTPSIPRNMQNKNKVVVDNDSSNGSNLSSSSQKPSRKASLVRTISSMEDSVLRNLIKRVPSHRGILKKSAIKRQASNDSINVEVKAKARSELSNSRVRFGGVQFEPRKARFQGPSDDNNGIAFPLTRQSGRLSLVDTCGSDDDTKEIGFRPGGLGREDSINLGGFRPAGLGREDSINLGMLDSVAPTRKPNATNLNNSMSVSMLQQQQLPSFTLNSSPNDAGGMGMSMSLSGMGGALGAFPAQDEDNADESLRYGEDFDDSKFDFMSEEMFALDKLAEFTDEMQHVDFEDSVVFKETFGNSRNEILMDEEDDMNLTRTHALQSLDEMDEAESSESSEEKYENSRPKLTNDVEIVLVSPTKKATETPLSIVVKRELKPSKSGLKNLSFAPLTADTRRSHSMRNMSVEKLSQSAEKPKRFVKPDLVRRNTCGTLYVSSTLSAPDKDATIKCVCGVYRAHLLQSERINEELSRSDAEGSMLDFNFSEEYNKKYSSFNDYESDQTHDQTLKNNLFDDSKRIESSSDPPIPTLDEITTFYRDVFQRAEMESDCIIISLIYVERLIKVTSGILRPRACNWRSVLFSCMVLSSKVWDDLSMWNADFSETCPAGVRFSLKRVNQLEIAVLNALTYQVKVLSSEYAKYYFLLRSMLIKSGLGSEDIRTMNPLDIDGARRLQQLSSQYEKNASSSNLMKLELIKRGSSEPTASSKKSGSLSEKVNVYNSNSEKNHEKNDNNAPNSKQQTKSPRPGKFGLEHIVKM